MKRDEIRMKNSKDFKCDSCEDYGHNYSFCCKTFYQPKNSKIFKILGESLIQDRKAHHRFDNKSYHTLRNRNMIGITAVNFGISLNLIKESEAELMNKF